VPDVHGGYEFGEDARSLDWSSVGTMSEPKLRTLRTIPELAGTHRQHDVMEYPTSITISRSDLLRGRQQSGNAPIHFQRNLSAGMGK